MTPESCGPANLVLLVGKITKDLFVNYQQRIADWSYNCNGSWKTGLDKAHLSFFGSITTLIDRGSSDNKVNLGFSKISDSIVPKFILKAPYSSHQMN